MWVTQPATTAPPEQPPIGHQIVARMASIPHGNALLAQGSAIPVPSLTNGTFQIAPVNTALFAAGTPMPIAGAKGGFPPCNLSDLSPAATSFRTPFGDTPAVPLPASINNVPMQTVINDPTRLLQEAINGQFIEKMVVLNIATVSSIDFTSGPIAVPAALVFATFWIETIKKPIGHFLQLQYVQTVLLNFQIELAPMLSWPHVSVATLRKTFG
jgi:hypothetical protein